MKTCGTCNRTLNGATQKKYCSRACWYVSLSTWAKEHKIIPPSQKGRKWTEEQKQRLRIVRSRYESSMKRPEVVAKMQIARKITFDTRGRKCKERDLIESSRAYKDWRLAVFKRDDWTCQMCLVRGGVLNADHIKPFATHPELRLELSNGRTLCRDCHKTTPTFGPRVHALKRALIQ